MPRVLLSASFSPDLILRQTPGKSGVWGSCEFVAFHESKDAGPADAWVVYDDLAQVQEASCPRANTLLVTGEPESLRRYRKRFTSQFGHIWTSHKSIDHAQRKLRNEGQHWHYALHPGPIHNEQLGFDELQAMRCPPKSKLISVICSSKADTEDHRKRLEFVQTLQKYFGDQLDVFGRGIRSIQDKSEAIYDYKYHIVLENDHSEFFMTEKLADAYLGWSYPIYFGSSEAYYRYPEGSFTAIDIYNPQEAISLIRSLLDSDTYNLCLPHIAEARERVLYANNICSMLSNFWSNSLDSSSQGTTRLFPKRQRLHLVYEQMRRFVQTPFPRSPSKAA